MTLHLKVVTSNLGKVREYQAALAEYGVEMEHVHVPYDEVQTSYLEEVVDKGLKALYAQGLRNFMIDDSGLFINGLNGFPGVWSAYAQKTLGNPGILKLMENIKDRAAVFKCCIGACISDQTIIVTGVCPGLITQKEAGTDGFGYDPIFSPGMDGGPTFAMIPIAEKNQYSHRGIAIRMLIDELKARKFI
ncbi:MAG: non-canonical purine NTP pyrophosphatase [Candidatus Methanomethylophilus sp.]|nr:non-canonical purine NTP pyrophosphatase [Methanomethylophilus sp.]